MITVKDESNYAVQVGITHENNGMLEQGGVSGRVVRVNKNNIGMPADANLNDVINDSGATWQDRIIEYVRSNNWYGDQTLVNGQIIR